MKSCYESSLDDAAATKDGYEQTIVYAHQELDEQVIERKGEPDQSGRQHVRYSVFEAGAKKDADNNLRDHPKYDHRASAEERQECG